MNDKSHSRGARPRTPITFFVRPKKVIKETQPRFAAPACVVGASAPYNHGVLLAADRGGAQGDEIQNLKPVWCATNCPPMPT